MGHIRPRSVVVLAALVFPVSASVFDGSFSRLQGRADQADGVQLFTEAQMGNVSSSCLTAMTQSVSCSEASIAQLDLAKYENFQFTVDLLAQLCTQTCGDSLAAMQKEVVNSCGPDDILYFPTLQGQNATSYVQGTDTQVKVYTEGYDPMRPIWFLNNIVLSQKTACLKDDQDWCYLRMMENNGTEVCDVCHFDNLRAHLEDPSYYNSRAENSYSSKATSCGIDATPITSPTVSVHVPRPTTSSPTRACTGSLVAVETGANCDEFARSHSMGTHQILQLNGLRCVNFPGGKDKLCVEGSCVPYTVKQNDTCYSISKAAGISEIQLLSWNPRIDPKCSGLSKLVGRVLCVSNPTGFKKPTITGWPSITSTPGAWPPSTRTGGKNFEEFPTATSVWTHPPLTPTSTGPSYPLASGSLSDCAVMYNNEKTNFLCIGAAAIWGVDIEQWVEWNPSVLENGQLNSATCYLEPETQYCGSFWDPEEVPVQFIETLYPPVPGDATEGATAECYDWRRTVEGDTCAGLADRFLITVEDLYRWNPAVGPECTNLWIDASYCVAGKSEGEPDDDGDGEDGGSGIEPPTQVQEGVVEGCQEWYVAKEGDTCSGVAEDYGLTIDQFVEWNPAVTAGSCDGFWIDYSYCVKGPDESGGSPQPTSTTTTQPNPTSNPVNPPGPTQTGIPTNCNKYDVAEKGDTCINFSERNRISLSNLYKWNPVLEDDCSNFWAGNAYCVGVKA